MNSVDANSVFQLDLSSLHWTILMVGPGPSGRRDFSFTAISDEKIVLHGGINHYRKKLDDIFLLDVLSKTWCQYANMKEANARYRYVQKTRELPTYGMTTFAVRSKVPDAKKLQGERWGLSVDLFVLTPSQSPSWALPGTPSC